jgi:hypothetical protein
MRPNMNARFVAIGLFITVISLAQALAQGEPAKPASGEPAKKVSAEPAKKESGEPAKKVSGHPGVKRVSRSVGSRTAACKLDCSAGHLHGTYRVYGASDPQLKSPESRKLFNECVRLCLDPLPEFYVQKSIVESGGTWFGKNKADCLGCHAVGKPKRFWPGINTIPQSLKGDSSTR